MPDGTSELSTDHLLSGLGSRSVRGGAITFGAQAFKLVLQVATIAILARLLPPAVFGLIAMVTALSMVLDLVKELGLSAATIRKSDITQPEVSALFWVNVMAGAAIAAALFLAAPLVAAFYRQPELIGITRWLSLGFLLSGLTVQHWALLRRQMRFTAAVVIDIGSEIAGFVVAIVLARAGAGYWALVAQRLTVPLFVLIGAWSLCGWRPDAPRLAVGISEHLRFGASVTGVNIAAAISRTMDQVLIGWLWGANALGFYERAAKLLLTPAINLSVPLYAVAMPGLSRIESDEPRYRRAFCGILEKLAMAVIPGALFIAVTADWVVRIVLGPQWQSAAQLVACFALAAACQPLMQTVGLLYLTQNRPREMVRAAAIDTALCLCAVLGALPYGVKAVAVALAVVGLALRAPISFWLSTRQGAVTFADVVAAILPSGFASLVTAGTVVVLRRTLLDGDMPAVEAMSAAAIMALPMTLGALYAMPQSRRALQSFRAMASHLRGPAPDFNR
ncbi:MAG TPA: lipopolysaccharide biosynthesis protein [Stellaceae bacterium]|nr:lipopolysaccharide biosynthesis protein [Stellaceae bacterium]